MGCLAALSCAFFSAVNVVCVHGLPQFHRNTLLFNSSVAGFFITLLALPFDEKSLLFRDIQNVNMGQLTLVAGIAVISLFLFFEGCRNVTPTLFTMIRSSEIIVTFLLQAVVNHIIPSELTVFGGFFVMLSGICIGLEEAVRRRVRSNLLKKIL